MSSMRVASVGWWGKPLWGGFKEEWEQKAWRQYRKKCSESFVVREGWKMVPALEGASGGAFIIL